MSNTLCSFKTTVDFEKTFPEQTEGNKNLNSKVNTTLGKCRHTVVAHISAKLMLIKKNELTMLYLQYIGCIIVS